MILGHNLAHTTTVELSRHVQIYVFISSLQMKLMQNEFLQDSSFELINSLWNWILCLRKMGPAIKDSLFGEPQGAPQFGLGKLT